MALRLKPCLLASWAVRKGDVIVGDVVEEVDLFLLEEEAGCNGVDWSITPAFIEEPAISIERFEKINVRLRSEPL